MAQVPDLPIRQVQGFGWRPDHPDHRDHTLELAAPYLGRLPPHGSVRVALKAVPVFNQGDLGSCVSQGTALALLFAQLKDKEPRTVQPARLFIYYFARLLEGVADQDAGCEIRDAIKVVARLGFPDETLWPYEIDRFADQPPDSVLSAASKDRITRYYRVPQSERSFQQCIASGFPFVGGITVYESFKSDEVMRTGKVPMPDPSERVLGGHCLYFDEYDIPTRRFGGWNSWGEGWGDGGHFTIPFDYLTNPDLACDFWTVRQERQVA